MCPSFGASMHAHRDEANYAGPQVVYQVEVHGSDDGQCEWRFLTLSGNSKFQFQAAHSITVGELKIRMDALDGNEPSLVDVFDLGTNERIIDERRLLTPADSITVGVRALASGRDLEELARRIVLKVLAEPHHCETFVSKAMSLALQCPDFAPEGDKGSIHSFTTALKHVCQGTFQRLVADDSQLDAGVRKQTMMALVTFLGNLFAHDHRRELVPIPIILCVLHALIGNSKSLPEEFMVECACKLLQLVQDTERMQSPPGRRLMNVVARRLSHLKVAVDPETSKPIFSASTQQDIQDCTKQFCGELTARGA